MTRHNLVKNGNRNGNRGKHCQINLTLPDPCACSDLRDENSTIYPPRAAGLRKQSAWPGLNEENHATSTKIFASTAPSRARGAC